MVKPNAEQRRNLLIRVAGLLYIGLLALVTGACGLALAFGNYRLSMFFFFAAVALLVLAKVLALVLR